MKTGRLVQRQAGRGHGHRPERDRRPVRLCLRRRPPDLQPRRREADDERHLPGRRDAARLCRADRHQRQHRHPRQGHPPRVPPRRGRCRSTRSRSSARQDRIQSSASSRRIWRSSRPRARRPTGSCSASTSRRRRPASCSCRPAIRASSASSRQPVGRASAISWARARSCAPAVNYSRYSQVGRSSASPSPICSTSNILLGVDIYPPRLQQLQLRRQRPQHDLRAESAPAASFALGFPVTEYLTLRHALRARSTTRSRSTRTPSSPIPTATGPLPLECDPLKAGRYLCDEIGSRLTSSIGYSLLFDNTNGIRPTRGQRVMLSQDFAGLGGDVKYLRTRARRDQILAAPAAASSSRLTPRAAISTRCRTTPGDGPAMRSASPTASSAPQMRGFDIRGIGPRVQRTPL